MTMITPSLHACRSSPSPSMLSFSLILDHMHSTEKLVRSSDQVLLLDDSRGSPGTELELDRKSVV